jgi:Fe-S cluster biogenesis protein NfuA
LITPSLAGFFVYRFPLLFLLYYFLIGITMTMSVAAPLEERIQQVLDGYRPILYKDGGDVQLLKVDEKGVAHVKMFGACIDCPISLLTMKLGIQRLLKEHFSEITGLHAITDIDLAALYQRQAPATS